MSCYAMLGYVPATYVNVEKCPHEEVNIIAEWSRNSTVGKVLLNYVFNNGELRAAVPIMETIQDRLIAEIGGYETTIERSKQVLEYSKVLTAEDVCNILDDIDAAKEAIEELKGAHYMLCNLCGDGLVIFWG